MTTQNFDVVVVGGGAAGLSAALMLGRSRRSVLVLDAGEPRNAPAAGVHGLLGHEGTPPGELLRAGRAEVEAYGVVVRAARASAATRDDTGFVVTLDDGTPGDGTTVHARRIVLTTGVVDQLPDVPGLAARWGHDVLHCPYCHGWEVRDKKIVVLATGPMAVHQALLFRQLSADVTVVLHEQPPLADEQAEELAAIGVRVVAEEVAEVVAENDVLTGVTLRSGQVVAAEAVVVASRPVARPDLLADLGLETAELPGNMGTHVPADAMGVTAAPGVWAAGNLVDPFAQVGASAAAGAKAGAMINADLAAAEAREAVQRRRALHAEPAR
ncbi:NAD(P)/FAD-dependent oxidoreductase [Pseudonocardia sp. N23]|uniref:NAD(P)/FAD-dependent oxidoreductase n=1 Tax=Pseudonocardia sp. N23 TaxID=1987376 RepID=UPI000BFD16C9|nr:NAD(P)/FAD-dependent oxidoreductase [Pseudonocardia sp. N23]GAY10267.1 thioredoxin reductase [Pseudonocardia sp. N23]